MDALAKLGIDAWGLVLYLVNFGILLVLMQRFVYKPLVKKLDERRDTIHSDVEAAKSMRSELEMQREQEAEERKKREQALDERVQSVKASVREDAKKMLTEAEAQRDSILAQASQVADERVASTISDAEREIISRMNKVVRHVLQDAVSEKDIETSVEKSWAQVTDLS